MSRPLELNSLLVPVDFSGPSEKAYELALALATGENPVVILLHVIDSALVEFAVANGWGSHEEVIAQLRQRSESKLQVHRQSAAKGVEIDAIVSEGVPFLEIIRKADDFAVDAIVIGKVGTRGPVEKLLFGSTAEKVLRGSRRLVIVLPDLE